MSKLAQEKFNQVVNAAVTAAFSQIGVSQHNDIMKKVSESSEGLAQIQQENQALLDNADTIITDVQAAREDYARHCHLLEADLPDTVREQLEPLRDASEQRLAAAEEKKKNLEGLIEYLAAKDYQAYLDAYYDFVMEMGKAKLELSPEAEMPAMTDEMKQELEDHAKQAFQAALVEDTWGRMAKHLNRLFDTDFKYDENLIETEDYLDGARLFEEATDTDEAQTASTSSAPASTAFFTKLPAMTQQLRTMYAKADAESQFRAQVSKHVHDAGIDLLSLPATALTKFDLLCETLRAQKIDLSSLDVHIKFQLHTMMRQLFLSEFDAQEQLEAAPSSLRP